MTPRGLVASLIIGLIAGSLAGRVVVGKGFGCLANTVIGLAGALIGDVLLRQLGGASGVADRGLLEDMVVSFLGAVLLLGVLQLLKPGRRGSGGGLGRWRGH